MTQYSLGIDQWSIMLPGLVMGFGVGGATVPATAMAFATVPRGQFNEGTALYALVRNLGNSIGISLMQGLLVHNMQTAHASLAAHITPFNRSLPSPMGAVRSSEWLNTQVTTQAALIAYIDDFKFLCVAVLLLMPLLLLVRPSGTKTDITEAAVE